MKKQQIILVSGGAALLCILYFFGRTLPPKKISAEVKTEAKKSSFDIQTLLQASKNQLTTDQRAYLDGLENSVVRGNVKEQQAAVYKQMAAFYRDSAHLLLPFAYYTGESAKLENSEKSLTFAARFFLESFRRQENPDLKRWMADESRKLFEKALAINPNDDSLKVGLGSCYLFGDISDNPMQGITIIREVAERDPENMYAQFMLGAGGLLSGQLNKAIERLLTVASKQPDNVEAKLMLAEAYERKLDKVNAIKWYEAVKSHVNNAEIMREIDKRIDQLKK